MTQKRIAILGSTGSIGTQALEVIRQHPEQFSAEILSAQENSRLLIQQALEFMPNSVVIGNKTKYQEVRDALASHDIKVFAGEESIVQIAESGEIDMVLAAIVGFAGLASTLRAVQAGIPVALANKETLVVAGNLITKTAREKGVNLYPVDSEHSAIFQCLAGEFQNPVEKIILTASGGPFRGKDRSFLEQATPAAALQHPNWNMGAKVTIDSASLMNKGLEVIEAHWLFNLKPEQIEVIIHPQSIIHSMVQFTDGCIKAQMGVPDMRLPIQYAFSYPARLSTDFPRFSFTDHPALTFEKPDRALFQHLDLAYDALNSKGNASCIMNAANEIAVEAFLSGHIRFTEMYDVIAWTMGHVDFIKEPGLDEYILSDREARAKANEYIMKQLNHI
jgi:1-deoxy-D-xylulose-5-phosphate reductoisomerase